jgi:integrase
MRTKGTGSVVKLKYKQNGQQVESRFYYILYYDLNGKQHRESTKSESSMEAEKTLQRRLGEMGLGIRPQQEVRSLKYEVVRDAYLQDYRSQGGCFFRKADGTEYINGMAHLDEFFKNIRVIDITTELLRRYITHRRKQGASDPTIRRNLVILRAMLNLARKDGKIRQSDIAYFPMPQDSKPRTGFVDPDVFNKLLNELPEHLRPLIRFMYRTGCRKGAALKITWDMVSADASEIQLPGEITKSGDPLNLPLVGEGLEEIATMLRKMFRKAGQPVFNATNLRKEWCKACHGLGLGKYEDELYTGLTIHDLRRSAVRNLVRAGIPRGIAMQITGHVTEHVFERYNITSGDDIRDALIKVGQYEKMKVEAARKSA